MEDRSAEVSPLLYTQSLDIDCQDHNRLYSTCETNREQSFDREDEAIWRDCSDSEVDDTNSMKNRRASRLKEIGGWVGYLKDFSIFLPYIIPKKDRTVQACIILNILCLIGNRILNVLVPRQLGLVADQLLKGQSPVKALLIWLVLSLLNEESGIGLIQSLIKIPIKQFSYRQISNASFNHIMNLSLDYHSERDSAEVMKAIEQGEALANILETLILEILPTTLDLIIAFGFLYWKFGIYVPLVMAIASAIFMSLQFITSNWNIDNRRQSARAQREESRVMHQAVQGWQNVAYFNMFHFESLRFGGAVGAQLAASAKWSRQEAYTQALLESMLPTTFSILAGLVFYEIHRGKATAGDFVFLIQYWDQLIFPLKMLFHEYRYIMSDLIDAERLMALLQTKPSIIDQKDAQDYQKAVGRVDFEQVNFSYHPTKATIQNLTISAAPGQTVAFVGETGAGKSTIIKLLLRFYDVDSGHIRIDGRDIRSMTLSSLRSIIGVVPQDPLLFNATILENLRYARMSASDHEIFDACRAASIHDNILGFRNGYNTKVGENGIKLSGGEIQRLAIARVFLKGPPIIVFDEATSSMDSNTERTIQQALDSFKVGRTTFIIAHRLSTIVGADKILVVQNGRIIESGTHNELKEMKGVYNDLWVKQIGN